MNEDTELSNSKHSWIMSQSCDHHSFTSRLRQDDFDVFFVAIRFRLLFSQLQINGDHWCTIPLGWCHKVLTFCAESGCRDSPSHSVTSTHWMVMVWLPIGYVTHAIVVTFSIYICVCVRFVYAPDDTKDVYCNNTHNGRCCDVLNDDGDERHYNFPL